MPPADNSEVIGRLVIAGTNPSLAPIAVRGVSFNVTAPVATAGGGAGLGKSIVSALEIVSTQGPNSAALLGLIAQGAHRTSATLELGPEEAPYLRYQLSDVQLTKLEPHQGDSGVGVVETIAVASSSQTLTSVGAGPNGRPQVGTFDMSGAMGGASVIGVDFSTTTAATFGSATAAGKPAFSFSVDLPVSAETATLFDRAARGIHSPTAKLVLPESGYDFTEVVMTKVQIESKGQLGLGPVVTVSFAPKMVTQTSGANVFGWNLVTNEKV